MMAKPANFWNHGGGPTGQFVLTAKTPAKKRFPNWRRKGPADAGFAKESISVVLVAGNSRLPWEQSWNVPTFPFQNG